MEIGQVVVLIMVFIMIGIAYVGFMVRNLITRNQLYRRLINSYIEKNVGYDWYKVRFSSEGHFIKWLKLVPWDGNGLLVMKNNNVSLLFSLQEEMNKTFDKKKIHLKWVGRKNWHNGAFSWFCIEEEGKQIYFTSETGFSGLNSDKSTKEIFKSAEKSIGCDA